MVISHILLDGGELLALWTLGSRRCRFGDGFDTVVPVTSTDENVSSLGRH